MKPLAIEAIAVVGPGLDGWEQTASVLRAPDSYTGGELPPLPSNLFPGNERRRTTELVRLAVQVVHQLAKVSTLDLAQTVSVFSSAEGDMAVADRICSALTMPGMPVSPVQFQNVVHNAPAGYWSITAGAQLGSTSINAGHAAFAAGLVDAYANLRNGAAPVLFVCYDTPGPAVLEAHRPISAPFAVAMTLTLEPTARRCGVIEFDIVAEQPTTALAPGMLDALRAGNPAARGLSVLSHIANGTQDRVFLPYTSRSSLMIDVYPT